MPHQGVLPKLFPGMSIRLQDYKLQMKMLLRELPAAAWAGYILGILRLCADSGFAGTRATLRMTSSKDFFEETDFSEL